MFVEVFHQRGEGGEFLGIPGEVPVPIHVIDVIPLCILRERGSGMGEGHWSPCPTGLGGYLGDLVVPHGSHSLPRLIAGSVAPAAEVEAKSPDGRHGWETCSETVGAWMGFPKMTAPSPKHGKVRGEGG